MADCMFVQVIESRANRCFYVAHAHLAAGKQLEAHALFGRAAQHAKLAAKQHQVRCLALPCVTVSVPLVAPSLAAQVLPPQQT